MYTRRRPVTCSHVCDKLRCLRRNTSMCQPSRLTNVPSNRHSSAFSTRQPSFCQRQLCLPSTIHSSRLLSLSRIDLSTENVSNSACPFLRRRKSVAADLWMTDVECIIIELSCRWRMSRNVSSDSHNTLIHKCIGQHPATAAAHLACPPQSSAAANISRQAYSRRRSVSVVVPASLSLSHTHAHTHTPYIHSGTAVSNRNRRLLMVLKNYPPVKALTLLTTW